MDEKPVAIANAYDHKPTADRPIFANLTDRKYHPIDRSIDRKTTIDRRDI
jgi:hypothetical protein